MSEIHKRLAKAQANMGNPKLDKVNPRFGTKYATLQSVLACVKGPLNEQGLFFWNEVMYENGKAYMLTMVSDGESIVSLGKVEHIPANDPQKNGSALTYSKRYSLCAAFGVVGEEDDDGNAAQPSRGGQRQQRQQQQQHAQQQPQTPWNALVDVFYANCANAQIDPAQTWSQLIAELGYEPNPQMDAQQLAPAVEWAKKIRG